MDKENKSLWLTYMHPYRLVTHDEEIVHFPIEEINNCSYNHGLLCRIIGSINNSFNGQLLEYLVCGDGAFAIKTDLPLTENDLLLHFNDLFCKVLLGGILVDCISNKDLANGSIHEQRAIWPVSFGHSYNSHIHATIRMKLTNSFDAIVLSGASSIAITISELQSKLLAGQRITERINNLSTYHLIVGITEIQYGNWSAAVSNLWIVAEQLTDFLWERDYVNNDERNPNIPSRKQALLQDHRTYSASVKQEILFQIGILTSTTYADLYSVRKARNRLIHEGKMVNELDAKKLYAVVDSLLKRASNTQRDYVLPKLNEQHRYH